jgi:hypothetical protein
MNPLPFREAGAGAGALGAAWAAWADGGGYVPTAGIIGSVARRVRAVRCAH